MLLISRPDDVEEALSSPALSVARSVQPVGAAQRLQSRMARFSDGEDHARRRDLVLARLSDLGVVEACAAHRTGALIEAEATPFDVMPLARTVPVAADRSVSGSSWLCGGTRRCNPPDGSR